jgi:hypothetical protein
MAQTEAMQLIKRTQCKLRPSPKSGEKQVSVGQCKAKTKAREGGQFP